jgi:hypothetical protein
MFSLFDIPFRRQRYYNPWIIPQRRYRINPVVLSYDRDFDDDDFFFNPFIREQYRLAEHQEKEREIEKEKEEEKELNRVQRYECSEQIISESNGRGFERVKREMKDSRSGKTTVIETRRIGEQSMTLHRETDREGNVTQRETRTNITEDQLESFQTRWNEFHSAQSAPSIEAPHPETQSQPPSQPNAPLDAPQPTL